MLQLKASFLLCKLAGCKHKHACMQLLCWLVDAAMYAAGLAGCYNPVTNQVAEASLSALCIYTSKHKSVVAGSSCSMLAASWCCAVLCAVLCSGLEQCLAARCYRGHLNCLWMGHLYCSINTAVSLAQCCTVASIAMFTKQPATPDSAHFLGER